MYAGHAAVALALTRRRPRVPIVPLVLAAFGPDWLEVLLMIPGQREGTAMLTHSIPAVLIGGGIAAALYAATRRPGARTILLAWLLHPVADLLTGRKPLLTADHLIGLGLYGNPAADFALESAVIMIGCVIYARAFPSRGEIRRVVVILCAALIAMQAAVDVALSAIRDKEWAPSFADVRGRSRPWPLRSHDRASGRMLALFPRTHHTRERWRWTVHEAS